MNWGYPMNAKAEATKLGEFLPTVVGRTALKVLDAKASRPRPRIMSHPDGYLDNTLKSSTILSLNYRKLGINALIRL